ncbi:hypothetical protein Taro_035259 [Colocasia esculenta]|uniref:Aminotransferase-like plant mobile domain-containing protein n=1 Tax=Colocasia esculenta TaxID=4460 RepID=A0A843VZY7_COLES|nr:hypothetical protein [Colocasia esculenta]
MLNDDADFTEFYSANERDVRHHVLEEHVIEEDKEDEIDSQDDIDDNENMDEGDDEPLFEIVREIEVLKCWEHYRSLGGWPVDPRIVDYNFDRAGRYLWGGATLVYLYRQLSVACKSDAKAICDSLTLLQFSSWERLYVGRPDITMHPLAQDRPLGHRWNVSREEINNPRHVLRLYRSELDHQEDYQMHVPDRVLRQFGRVQPIPGPLDALDRVTRKGRGHIDWATYFAHFV